MQPPYPLAPIPTLPIPVNPFGVLGSILTKSQLQADVANSGSGTVTPLGLSVPVQAGDSWSFHWDLWVGSNAGVAGGCRIFFILPATTVARICVLGCGANQGAMSIQTPQPGASAGPLVTFDASASNLEGKLYIDIAAVFSAGGTVDIDFRPNTNGQNYICRRPSSLIAYKM